MAVLCQQTLHQVDVFPHEGRTRRFVWETHVCFDTCAGNLRTFERGKIDESSRVALDSLAEIGQLRQADLVSEDRREPFRIRRELGRNDESTGGRLIELFEKIPFAPFARESDEANSLQLLQVVADVLARTAEPPRDSGGCGGGAQCFENFGANGMGQRANLF